MKRVFPCLVVLLSGCFAEPVKGVGDAHTIMSEEGLRSAVLELSDPSTEMAALRRLIKFSDFFLYNGHLRLVTEDQATDERRQAAARAVHSHRSVESVRRALSSVDRDVRYWGVMHFHCSRWVGNPEELEPWKPFLPRLEELASRDEDPGIRIAAILTLRDYEETAVFLTKLQELPDETHPSVLMELLEFNSELPELRTRWYARAAKFLTGKDEALRMLWLQVIWGNVSNPGTAPMWKIDAYPALVESLNQIADTGSKAEKELASETLKALAMKPKTSR